MKLVVVSGMSGAGKSIAMHVLEDLGYNCVDNLPIALLPAFAAELDGPAKGLYERSAVAIDARNPAGVLEGLPAIIDSLRAQGILSDLVFLEADDAVLLKRFKETRRKHPLTAGNVSLAEAIRRERELLAPVKRAADIVMDTTATNIHQLRDMVRQRVDRRPFRHVSLLFLSFGFKHGVPQDADMVFDVRCLPNPHWEPSLRPLTGRDPAVAQFLAKDPMVDDMTRSVGEFLDRWVPEFERENRAYLTVAIGCTGGQHRSVYMAERLAEQFRAAREGVMVRHRELG